MIMYPDAWVVLSGPVPFDEDSVVGLLRGVETRFSPKVMYDYAHAALVRAAIDAAVPPGMDRPETRRESESRYGRAPMSDTHAAIVRTTKGLRLLVASGSIAGKRYTWAERLGT